MYIEKTMETLSFLGLKFFEVFVIFTYIFEHKVCVGVGRGENPPIENVYQRIHWNIKMVISLSFHILAIFKKGCKFLFQAKRFGLWILHIVYFYLQSPTYTRQHSQSFWHCQHHCQWHSLPPSMVQFIEWYL